MILDHGDAALSKNAFLKSLLEVCIQTILLIFNNVNLTFLAPQVCRGEVSLLPVKKDKISKINT